MCWFVRRPNVGAEEGGGTPELVATVANNDSIEVYGARASGRWVRDYTRFLQMIANGGELHGVRILKKETVAAMTRNQLVRLIREAGRSAVERDTLYNVLWEDDGSPLEGIRLDASVPYSSEAQKTRLRVLA